MKNEMKIFVICVFLLALSISASDYFLKTEMENGNNTLTAGMVKIGGGDVLGGSYTEDILKTQLSNWDVAFPSLRVGLVKKDAVNSEKMKSENTDVLLGSNVSEFLKIPLEAKSMYIFDIALNKEIFGKNADLKFPLASIVKLMTAVVAKENFPEDTVITISKNAVKEDGDSGFTPGEKFRLNDLISAMLVGSINDAAYAFFESAESLNVGVKKPQLITLMNDKARELKMNNTVFINSTGLDVGVKEAGGVSSARDVFLLMKYFLENHYDIIQETGKKNFKIVSLDHAPHEFKNTNILLDKYSRVIYGKTGYTELSGGNFVFVFEKTPQEKFIIVILGSTYDGRFRDAEKIISVIADI